MLLSKTNKVFVKFPKVGLGNMLLVWARAIVFCKINQLELTTSSWCGFRWGALIRRESRNRFYYKYFIESSFISKLLINIKKIFSTIIYEPDLKEVDLNNNKIYIFNKNKIHNDLFYGLRDYQSYIKIKIEEKLHYRIKKIIDKEKISCISIHVRRGDFKKGNPITPLSHYLKGIELIRKHTNKNLSVTIFSDADLNEIQPLLEIDNVKLANRNPDIVDILLMSKSKVIFLSQSSSFSYWAAFLSDSLVIIPSNDWQMKIKENKNSYKEIRWNENDFTASNELINSLNKIDF